MRRHCYLPNQGSLLVNTDLHGNAEDFFTLRELFFSLPNDTHWVVLGDLVHGPDDRSRQEDPSLYGYPDESGTIAFELLALRRAHPDRVHFVLGNHDHGHIGGVHTAKFHDDEVAFFEENFAPEQVSALRTLCNEALLAVAAPCGLLLTHGSPDATMQSLEELDAISLDGNGNTPQQRRVLNSILRSYGQPETVSRILLEQLSRTGPFPLHAVVHGHDRDEFGAYVHGETQLCAVLFGAKREHKSYILADLSANYRGPEELRPGLERRKLYSGS